MSSTATEVEWGDALDTVGDGLDRGAVSLGPAQALTAQPTTTRDTSASAPRGALDVSPSTVGTASP